MQKNMHLLLRSCNWLILENLLWNLIQLDPLTWIVRRVFNNSRGYTQSVELNPATAPATDEIGNGTLAGSPSFGVNKVFTVSYAKSCNNNKNPTARKPYFRIWTKGRRRRRRKFTTPLMMVMMILVMQSSIFAEMRLDHKTGKQLFCLLYIGMYLDGFARCNTNHIDTIASEKPLPAISSQYILNHAGDGCSSSANHEMCPNGFDGCHCCSGYCTCKCPTQQSLHWRIFIVWFVFHWFPCYSILLLLLFVMTTTISLLCLLNISLCKSQYLPAQQTGPTKIQTEKITSYELLKMKLVWWFP